jgi:hypothetical protein
MDAVTLLAGAVGLLLALAGKLIAAEIQDWLPTLARRLVDYSSSLIPETERCRYKEEWYSHLDECPGKIGKLWHACGCLRAARALAIESKTFGDASNKSSDSRAAGNLVFACALCNANTPYRIVRNETPLKFGGLAFEEEMFVCDICNAELHFFKPGEPSR